MGAGASAGLGAALGAASGDDIKALIAKLDPASRKKIQDALNLATHNAMVGEWGAGAFTDIKNPAWDKYFAKDLVS